MDNLSRAEITSGNSHSQSVISGTDETVSHDLPSSSEAIELPGPSNEFDALHRATDDITNLLSEDMDYYEDAQPTIATVNGFGNVWTIQTAASVDESRQQNDDGAVSLVQSTEEVAYDLEYNRLIEKKLKKLERRRLLMERNLNNTFFTLGQKLDHLVNTYMAQSNDVNDHMAQSDAINDHMAQSNAVNDHMEQSNAVNCHMAQSNTVNDHMAPSDTGNLLNVEMASPHEEITIYSEVSNATNALMTSTDTERISLEVQPAPLHQEITVNSAISNDEDVLMTSTDTERISLEVEPAPLHQEITVNSAISNDEDVLMTSTDTERILPDVEMVLPYEEIIIYSEVLSTIPEEEDTDSYASQLEERTSLLSINEDERMNSGSLSVLNLDGYDRRNLSRNLDI